MVSVRLSGEKELSARFKAAAKADFRAANLEAAQTVAGDATSRVPVLTGRLQASIRASATPKAGVVRAGFARLPYAGVIHFGWPRHNIAPNPFLYDALDARSAEVFEVFRKRLETIMDAERGE